MFLIRYWGGRPSAAEGGNRPSHQQWWGRGNWTITSSECTVIAPSELHLCRSEPILCVSLVLVDPALPSPPLDDQSSSGPISSCPLPFGLLHCTSLTPLGMCALYASPKMLEGLRSNMSFFYSCLNIPVLPPHLYLISLLLLGHGGCCFLPPSPSSQFMTLLPLRAMPSTESHPL